RTSVHVMHFVFQAEDGVRDFHVTGVQTCALPISPREGEYQRLFGRLESLAIPVVAAMHGTVLGGGLELALACHYRVAAPGTRLRSEERRVGQECRTRSSTYVTARRRAARHAEVAL